MEDKLEIIEKILLSDNVEAIYVFGSAAYKDMKFCNDIDIFVKYNNKPKLHEVIDLQDQLEEALGCSVDLVTDTNGDNYFLGEILKGIPVYMTKTFSDWLDDNIDEIRDDYELKELIINERLGLNE